MKRRYRNWWTSHQIRILLQYGWCPWCNSSPPDPSCPVCTGNPNHDRATLEVRSEWARRYIKVRG